MSRVTLVLAILLMLAACNSTDKDLAGAGATFPAPYYNILFKRYTEATGNNVAYGAVGSGGGVRSLKDQTVDFGATDVYVSDDELSKFGAEVVHIPTAVGAVVLSYNLPGVAQLRLNAEVISKIYRAEIVNWSDSQIKKLNPDANLPNQTITAVHRSDGSGTTSVLSDYMAKRDKAWSKEIGRGKSLNFPTGVAGKGNPGVAGIVSATVGAIGYVGSEYAFALKMSSALVENSSGNFIGADHMSVSLAADMEIPDDTRVSIVDSDNPQAYPISTFTWIIAYKEQSYNDRSLERAASFVSLLHFITSEQGQSIAARTHYAPLSGKALEKTKKIINSITYSGQSVGLSDER